MSVLVSHPTGNANLRAVLRALEGERELDSFWTCLSVPPFLTGGSAALFRRLGQRSFPEVAWSRTYTSPLREVTRLAARRLGCNWLTRHETGWASVDGVYHAIDRSVAQHINSPAGRSVRAVYAYEDGALETFRAAHRLGISSFYDLPTLHWRAIRRLLLEEAELEPTWAPTITGLLDSAAKLDRKDEEIALADRIFVASSFTRRSLEEHFGSDLPILLTPYGAPSQLVAQPAERRRDQPLELLFAGRLTQPKGLSYLIAALMRLDRPWRLTLAGARPTNGPAALDAFLSDPRCHWLGPIPHRSLLERMAQAHVLVFPSLLEGFGLVITEALAAGLPVITTTNTAGPDLLTDSVEGFIVPIRAPDAIADRLARLFDDEPQRSAMAQAALRNAAARTWTGYEATIMDEIRQVLQ